MQESGTFSHRTADLMDRRSGLLLVAIAVMTALLVIPMITMPPEGTASDQPGGEVYELQDLYNSKLPPRFHGAFFIAESLDGGDLLTREPLLELYRNTEALRTADREGRLSPPGLPEQPYQFNGFDADRLQPVVGIFTVADAVQEVLRAGLGTGLEDASDDQVKLALHLVMTDPRTESLADLVYSETVEEGRRVLGQEIDYWTAPALGVFVAADNEKLGGGAGQIGVTGSPVTEGKEHFNRNAQAILRGDQTNYRMWGVAIDAGLEIADEVATAVPFIAATFFMVLVVVGVSLRSWRVVILTALGLASMIVWLKGLSNLVGLDSSTVLDFIVPIAMISLGADFAIHAVNRYKEERRVTPDHRRAFRAGMAGVLAALVLAMITDAIAFLSNASAGIETVVGFGIGAGLAILAAFIIMGLALPTALMRLDAWRWKAPGDAVPAGPPPSEQEAAAKRLSLAGIVVALARWRLVVLPVAVLITAVSAYYAFRLEATFDVKDFFKSDSDFVVGLDKVDVHVGDSGGESAIIFIQGDLTDPAALSAVQDFIVRIGANPYVAKNGGVAQLQARPIFQVLDQVVKSDYTRSQIAGASGVTISTGDGLNEFPYGARVFRWPNSREELKAVYDYISVNGVYRDPDQKVYDSLEVGETLFHDPTGREEDVTAIVLGIPGTREQTNVVLSRESLGQEILSLEEAPSISRVGLTGSPYTRQGGLDATTDGLQRALVIAVVACLAVAIFAMRSVAFGVVTIIPIGLVVSWLYAFMYLFGFGLNFVTATIAAVSIGVGIDFAIHMTQRYREELLKPGDRTLALRRAAQGTGVALLASAATSIIGFAIMGFAPMPMFSSYGILTAMMIFLAAAASLLVLPSLLLLVTRGRPETVAETGPV